MRADGSESRGDGGDVKPSSAGAADAEQREKIKRLARRQRRSKRRQAEREARAATQAAASVAAVDADTLMESAGCDEEAEQAAAPLVELDQAAADSDGDVSPAMVAGAGDVGFVSMAPVEVEVLEEDEVEFKKGDVVVFCVEREEREGEVLVEPGEVRVGTVLGPAEYGCE